MRLNKKILYILVAFILTLSLSACGTEEIKSSPSEAVDKFMTDFKNGDMEALKTMGLDDVILEDESLIGDSSEMLDNLEKAFKNTSYEINSEEIDGENATVNVTVDSIDLDDVVTQAMLQSLREEFSDALSSGEISEEEKAIRQNEIFNMILEDPPFREMTGNFELVQEDNEWIITNGKELDELLFKVDLDNIDSPNP